MGREGALHFKEQLRQKRMAERLRESVAGGLSVEKTQKMIKRFVMRVTIIPCITHDPFCVVAALLRRNKKSTRAGTRKSV